MDKLYIEPGLHRNPGTVSQEKDDPMTSWKVILGLGIATVLVLSFQIFGVQKIVPEAKAAELPSMTDKQVYEEYRGQTKEICKTYLHDHAR